ncbi:ETX/MTX2 family pore-forming toxin [Enterococcus mundtii]|uniref:ETX/MTX2 family pore-forming toxin n=1 Tax=Enterococcus mundtii TaxID=53346 RepID=UPI00189AF2FF|nr:ETX/MTX2 family pore-forming toxin [Enterococcus mundtii]MDB7101453.1 ETX/MTX2 family pore-forming toxin [Enterococcus mundtii]
MKKVTKVMLGVVGATSLGLFTGEPVVQADELLPQIGEGYLKSVNQSTIDRMSTMSYALSFQMYQWGDIGVNERLTGNEYNPRNVSSQAYSVGVNSDMGTGQTSRTVNTSVFHNSTNQNQTFTTPSYSETYTDSTTTSTTQSAGVSTSTSTEIRVPMFGSATMGVELSYNFSTTTSHTREVKKSWTVPGQAINVRPGHTVEVNWVFYTGEATGSVNLEQQIRADIPYKKDAAGRIHTYGLGTVVGDRQVLSDSYWNRYISESRNNWKQVNANVAGRRIGGGTYRVDYGSGFVLEAFDRTTGTKEIIATGYQI